MGSIEKRVVATPGGPISYLEAGPALGSGAEGEAGQALLLMHGIGGNARSWRAQLEGLSDRFRVIAWDAPGYGDSGPREPTLAAYAGAAIALLDALKIQSSHILGHSMGGVVAQGVAGFAAERVDRLVLSSTFTGDAAPEGTPLGAGWNARLDDIQRLSPAEFGRARAAGMLGKGAGDAVRAEAAAIASAVTHAGLLGGCMLLHHGDTRALAARFAMPVLSLTGECDRIIPPARSAALADLINGCQSAQIPAVGHAAYLERPAIYNETLTGFLG
ncbi:MAG: alpha/beta hydrolase [Proteobacteria bacterium]|nr:alpha/beta hydrolase [Pseudomonadota bacterium]